MATEENSVPDPKLPDTAAEQPLRGSIGARRNPDTEAAVLEAAAALIGEEGYAKLTMEAVAKRARAGKATLYRWWPSRAHLLLALYSRGKMSLPRPDTGSLAEDLEQILTAMTRHWLGSPDQPATGPLLRLLIGEAQLDSAVAEALAEERRSRWHHIDAVILAARARGELNPAVKPNRAGQRVIGTMWYLLLTDQIPKPEDIPDLVQELLAGLRA